MAGMLDRTPAERKILAQLMRNGALDSVELAGRLPELDEAALKRALDLLVADGAVIREGETLRVVQKRTTRRGSRELLDRLGDF
jgi:predicted transcriptional regulator